MIARFLPDGTANRAGRAQNFDLDFSNGSKIATLTIPLNPDPDNYTIPIFIAGEITVTLDAVTGISQNYFVATSPNDEARVSVIDDDAPILSIKAGPYAVEGSTNNSNATFNVTTSVSPNKALTVHYAFNRKFSSDTANQTGVATTSLDFTSGKTEASFSLPLNPSNAVLG